MGVEAGGGVEVGSGGGGTTAPPNSFIWLMGFKVGSFTLHSKSPIPEIFMVDSVSCLMSCSSPLRKDSIGGKSGVPPGKLPGGDTFTNSFVSKDWVFS